ncbi:MAG: ROK family protein [Acidobacteria bacterium]|nr:ROK family protein [Acidobacteriota bacterium]
MIGAVDIGGTKLSVGIVDANGVVLAKMDAPTGSDSTYAVGLERTASMLRETAKQAGTNIAGIGIGSTGPVDPLTGEYGEVDFLPDWRHKNLVKDLAQAFGVQVAIENDGDAGALGEAGWGAGKGQSRLIYVTIGTGIGGGIVLDGKLYRGVDGAHPEVGHQVIDPSGPLCSCGFHGCWEALAAGPAMVAWFQATDDKRRQNISGKQICELALAGDPSALRVVQREGHYLGLGLANLINLFTPDMIVLGGSVAKCAILFLEEIRRTICRGCRFVPYEKTVLALASLGDDANLIGAARVWHHRFAQEV